MRKPIANNGEGNLPGMEWHLVEHTNQLIPLFAKGAASGRLLAYADDYDAVRGPFITNTDIPQLPFPLYAGTIASPLSEVTVSGPGALAVNVRVEGPSGPLSGVSVALSRGVEGVTNLPVRRRHHRR